MKLLTLCTNFCVRPCILRLYIKEQVVGNLLKLIFFLELLLGSRVVLVPMGEIIAVVILVIITHWAEGILVLTSSSSLVTALATW